MKITSLAVVLAIAALTLAPATDPCQAASIQYAFVEGTGAPHPGESGAEISLSSPPALSTASWTITNLDPIIAIRIFDPDLFPDGFTGLFPLTGGGLYSDLESATGSTIDQGYIESQSGSYSIHIGGGDTAFESETGLIIVSGQWLAVSPVPEPASVVPAGIAGAIGLALTAFRKRNEARRQRPVGALDANQ